MAKINIKTAAEIETMREAGRITGDILDAVESIIRPGISTEEINGFAHNMMLKRGVTPATLNYKGYPKSLCTSVNDVICHGIPSSYVILKQGDIINVDVTCIKDEYHGDASRMYFVGGEAACSEEARTLVRVAREAMLAGMAEVKPGNHIGDIGAGIQEYIASTGKDYGIVREYTGHGLGRVFHEAPQVIHVGKRGKGDLMLPGMTFTVEPMINAGNWRSEVSKIDGWTVRTIDGSLSAQWEHTLLVTETGYDILTLSSRERGL